MLSIASNLLSRRLPQLLTSLRNGSLKGIQTNPSQKISVVENSIDQKLNRIDAYVRRTGRVMRRDVDDVFKDIKSLPKDSSPTTTQSLLLIRCCGSLLSEEKPKVRNDLVKQIFETLSNTSKLDISHYNSLIQVYIDNEYDFNPLDILSQIQSKGIEPNRVTYQRLIHRFCQLGDISGATKILEFMKSKELPINESVFNSLILGYGRAGDLQSAYETLNIMKSSGLEPSADTYTALLCSYTSDAKNPQSIKRINELIEEANNNEIFLTDSDFLQVIKSIALVDSESKFIDELINKMSKSLGYNQECMKIVIDLVNLNQLNVAFKLYDTMKPNEKQLEQKTAGNVLIKHLIRANVSPDIVLEFCDKLKANGLNDSGLNRATEFALTFGTMSDARFYLKKFSAETPLRPHYFWPILVKCKNENEIFEVLSDDMASLSGADYNSLHDTFAYYIWPKDILDVDLFMEKCKAIGFSFALTYNALISHYLEHDLIHKVSDLICSQKYDSVRVQSRSLLQSLAEAFVRKPDVQNVVKILQHLMNSSRNSFSTETPIVDLCGRFILNFIGLKRSDNELVVQLLKALNKANLKISTESATAISDRIQSTPEIEQLLSKMSVELSGDTPFYDADDFAKPRKEMTPQELEEHLIELKSKGLNTRGVLRSLLLSYCRRSRFTSENQRDDLVEFAQKRVKEIIDQMNEEGFEFSNSMLASIFEFYVNCGIAEAAIEARNKISKDFELDAFKVFNFASFYVKKGEIEKAIELIKEEKARLSHSSVKEEDNLEEPQKRLYSDRSINRLLNNIIEQRKDAKLVKEVFELAYDYSGMPVSALMLGPLIKVHILNEDYSKALEEYVNCATKYRLVPSKNELMRIFLEKSDPTSLQTVIDHSNEIHGEMNTLIDLAAACITVGKIKQAKKLVETPGLRIRPEKLDFVCNKFIEENKTNELENFVLITKNMFDVNRDQLFYNLIRGYAKTNSPEKALNVWTLMQDENIQPSDRTLRYLGQFLRRSDVTVPFEVPPNPIEKESPANTPRTRDSVQSSTTNERLSPLNAAINRGDVDEALNITKALESKGETILLSQYCSIIEALLNADRIREAFDLTQPLLQSKRFPAPRILRYLLSKLALNGDLKMIDDLKPLLPNTVIQSTWFTSILANAYISAGKAEHFIDDVLPQLKPFPLGGLLAVLSARPDLESQVMNIANRIAREEDYHLPLNMVWLHFMQNERYDEAKQIYDSIPKFKDFLLFTALLDKIRETKNIKMGQKLIETVLGSNLTSKSIGIAYSALIDVCVDLGRLEEAEELILKEIISNQNTRIDPKTGTEQKIVDIENLNRTSVMRLIASIRDLRKREPKFSLPKKSFSSTNSLKSDKNDGNSSSDDEAVGLKQI